MSKISVVYEEDGIEGRLFPVSMIYECLDLDWTKTLLINIESPFERMTAIELDSDIVALAVPAHAYVLRSDLPMLFGIHLPTLEGYFRSIFPDEELFNKNQIERLIFRITDIEDTLQCEVRSIMQWA